MLWGRPEVPEAELDQRRLKASLLLEATKALGVDALGVGVGDLAFGLDFLLDGARRNALPYLSANLADAQGRLVFESRRMVERGGLKLGLTSVLGKELNVSGATVLDIQPAVEQEVRALREAGVDFVILLSNLGLEEDKRLAAAVAGVDLIFGSRTRRLQVDPLIVGTTAIFQAGSRGKYLGQVDLHLTEGGSGWANPEGRAKALERKARFEMQLERMEQRITAASDDRAKERLKRVQRQTSRRLEELMIPPPDDGSEHLLAGTKIPMGRALDDEPSMQKLVEATLEKLGDSVGASTGAAHDHSSHGHPPHGRSGDGKRRGDASLSGPYVGAKVCAGCHPAQYKDWSSTSHARAWTTLIREKRQYDQDCWSCHVTGAGQPGGPQDPKAVGSLSNVQCEACHGPGLKHVETAGKAPMKKSPDEALCRSCHSDEQTEGRFVWKDYLPKVDHKP
jgi:hypothetical protein